jgi:hypothetical protein
LCRRPRDVEDGVGDAVLADEAANVPVRQQIDRLGRVRDREAVLADEHRQQHVGCSASRGAMTVRSYASWAFSAKSWMTPESRISIESEWSQWMLIGPESARLPSAITIGARIEAAM